VCVETFESSTGNLDPVRPGDDVLAYMFVGAIAYHRLTADAAVRAWIVDQARYIQRARQHEYLGPASFNQWDGMAYAYHLTHDASLLAQPNYELQDALTDEKLVAAFLGARVWWMYKAGYLLDALVDAGSADVVPKSPPPESTAGMIKVLSDGNPFQLEVRLQWIKVSEPALAGRFGVSPDELGVTLQLLGPSDQVVEERPFPGSDPEPGYGGWYTQGGWIEAFNVEQPVPGIYTLRMAVPVLGKSLFQLYLTRNTLGKAMYEVGNDDGISPGYRYARGKDYVLHVPVGTPQFEVTFNHAGSNCDVFEFVMIDPNGNEHAKRNGGTPQSCVPMKVPEVFAINDPAPGWWQVHIGAAYKEAAPGQGLYDYARETRRFTLTGVPPFFGESEASAFAVL
jgi:hypothetical protein